MAAPVQRSSDSRAAAVRCRAPLWLLRRGSCLRKACLPPQCIRRQLPRCSRHPSLPAILCTTRRTTLGPHSRPKALRLVPAPRRCRGRRSTLLPVCLVHQPWAPCGGCLPLITRSRTSPHHRSDLAWRLGPRTRMCCGIRAHGNAFGVVPLDQGGFRDWSPWSSFWFW